MDMFNGLSLNTTRKLVYEFPEVNKTKKRFNKRTKMGSKIQYAIEYAHHLLNYELIPSHFDF